MQRYWLPRVWSPNYLNQRKLLISKISGLATRILEWWWSVLNITYWSTPLVSGLKWLDDDWRVVSFLKKWDGILTQGSPQVTEWDSSNLTPIMDVISWKKMINIVWVCSTACVLEVFKDIRSFVKQRTLELSTMPRIRVLWNYCLNTTVDSSFSRIKTEIDLWLYYRTHCVPKPNWKIV